MKCRSLISLTATVLMAGTFAACGGSGSTTGSTTGGGCTTPSTANSSQYLANMGNIAATGVTPPVTPAPAYGGEIEAPCSGADFDFAYFHSATVQGNQLGKLIGVLVSLDTTSTTTPGACPGPAPLGDPSLGTKPSVVQGGLNESLNSGQLGLGFTLTSADATYQSDTCAGLSLIAVSGSPTPATSGTATSFAGAISSGKFTSASPDKGDVQLMLALPIIPGAPAIPLPLHAVQITANTSGTVVQGQVNGALLASDLPGLVQGVINALPSLSASTQATITMLLDSGDGLTASCQTAATACIGQTVNGVTCATPSATVAGCCLNADNSCSAPLDGAVGVCEVLCNGTIGGLLKPDIQIYSSGTTYGPTQATPTKPDSISVGVGFTAKKGSF